MDRSWTVSVLTWTSILCQALLITTTSPAQAVDCKSELTGAEASYTQGQFSDALTLIMRCLETGDLSFADERQAYRLTGLVYIALDQPDSARVAVEHLLEVAPDYVANPAEDPPPFIQLVEQVRQEIAQQRPPPTEVPGVTAESEDRAAWVKWAVVGGGLVAGGVGACALWLCQTQDGTPGPQDGTQTGVLARPPALPQRE